MKKGESRFKGVLELMSVRAGRFFDHTQDRQDFGPVPETRGEESLQLNVAVQIEGSPLENTGPIPAELLKDPFPVVTVPWSMRKASENKQRERLILASAIIVSWAVTAIALLRALNVL